MRSLQIVTLESSGADSSGLTKARPEISGSDDVRLSEQHVVVLALYSVYAVFQHEAMWAFQIVLCPARRAALIEALSPSTCYPESRVRALVSLSGEGPALLLSTIS